MSAESTENALLPEPVVGVVVPKRQSAALRYPGSKWSIASQIASLFGPHYHYVEPYFGSGAVFFTKDPSPHELINDSNELVVNFFRVLRDRTDDLVWELEATPWSREEYDHSHIVTGDELEDARRFVVRIWQAHASDLAKRLVGRTEGFVRRRAGCPSAGSAFRQNLRTSPGALRMQKSSTGPRLM